MADSWEDHADDEPQQPQQQGGVPAFNAAAPAFVPNFNAPTFVPGGGGGFYAPPPGGMQQPMYGGGGGYGMMPPQQPGMYGAPPPGMYQQPPPMGGMPQQGGGYVPQFNAQQQQQQPRQQQQQQQQQQKPKQQNQPPAKAKTVELPSATKKQPAKTVELPSSNKEADAAPPAAAAKKEDKKPADAETPKKSSEGGGDGPAKKKEEKPAAKEEPEPVQEVEEEPEEDLEVDDKREHINIIFIGHVDAGKSTIGGHLMFLTGGVDKRTLEKYEREAREKNRESWYLSWALDTNEEERAKGKTVECGKAFFTTEKKHFTIIDAPGHKSFVPSMISGAVQADVAVLVISSRTGEFEAGFDRGGQTREHAMLAKSAGVKQLVVAINKMDTDNWSKARYDECVAGVTPYLQQLGFKKTDTYFLPLSGQTGEGLIEPVPKDKCAWFSGLPLVPFLDSLPPIKRDLDVPMRMPIVDKYSDMGTYVTGKLFSGRIKKGQKLMLMPNKQEVSIATILVDEEESTAALSGDNVKLKLKGAEEDEIQPGYVLCVKNNLCSVGNTFDAQVIILDYRTIICAGFQCVLHIHTAIEEISLKLLICYVDKKTGKPDKKKGKPRFLKPGDVSIVRIQAANNLCLESFKSVGSMGRFTLRVEGKSIAIGRVLKIVENN